MIDAFSARADADEPVTRATTSTPPATTAVVHGERVPARGEESAMARALVVYESMFGNTRTVAEAVAEGLTGFGDVEVVEVSHAPDTLPDDVELLVVGAPTHAFGLSRPSTRTSAAEQTASPLVSPGRGVREWLDVLAHNVNGTVAVAFDTRVKVGILPGSAAKLIAKRLRKLGFPPATPPKTFWVTGTTGPLRERQRDEAVEWARGITVGSRW
ncbi:flavodoxin-like protein [Saccharothrix variisporea]|uniref:Flavodoxin-like protein n=1 Tax=Saccharothrix variisporea TaxID=543527 RepID=A0A495XLB8_9PSEU|nr:flavodoxin-like protein [Saccharothrix variisporea]